MERYIGYEKDGAGQWKRIDGFSSELQAAAWLKYCDDRIAIDRKTMEHVAPWTSSIGAAA